MRRNSQLETIHWHTLDAGFLDEQSRVLDLGANYGRFSKAIVERFGCKCVAVEPTPLLYQTMLADERITKVNLAIAPNNGTAEFHVSAQSTASSLVATSIDTTETISVVTRRLDALVSDLGWDFVDLIKCDIEGAEIDVIGSCSDEFLQSVGQFTIEFHDFCGITPAAIVQETVKRLEGLGFWVVRMSRVGHQDTWLINQSRCDISKLEYLRAKYITRNWFGLKRVFNRLK